MISDADRLINEGGSVAALGNQLEAATLMYLVSKKEQKESTFNPLHDT